MDVRSTVYAPSRSQAAAAQGIDKVWETQYTKKYSGHAQKSRGKDIGKRYACKVKWI